MYIYVQASRYNKRETYIQHYTSIYPHELSLRRNWDVEAVTATTQYLSAALETVVVTITVAVSGHKKVTATAQPRYRYSCTSHLQPELAHTHMQPLGDCHGFYLNE